jgi:hypothetical protein
MDFIYRMVVNSPSLNMSKAECLNFSGFARGPSVQFVACNLFHGSARMQNRAVFNEKDLLQFQTLGITREEIQRQLEIFKKGPGYLTIDRSATTGDGIRKLHPDEETRTISAYVNYLSKNNTRPGKFIPASGTATRMFLDIFTWLNDHGTLLKPEVERAAREGDAHAGVTLDFMNNIHKFAFWPFLRAACGNNGINADAGILAGDFTETAGFLLAEKGLDYGGLPKGLLYFHSYPDGPRTPFQEHLSETALYARDHANTCRLHVTASQEHLLKFQEHLASFKETWEHRHKCRFWVDFSVQAHSMDTLAVTLDNQPYRQQDGTLLFRPGGHGALIENLNRVDFNVFFINNIDNVVMERDMPEVARWKKILGGLLVETQASVFKYMERLDNGEEEPGFLQEVYNFIKDVFGENRPMPEDRAEAVRFLKNRLDRPLRVCGMVKNQGDPGGAPFWVRDGEGGTSLQIVEAAQVNPDDSRQKELFRTSTHFNPVDIVCGVHDYQGRKYDLMRFVNPAAVFISTKTRMGKRVKSLELPGLWNGSMSLWNTLFVDTPSVAFHPVKWVCDLLQEAHQPL